MEDDTGCLNCNNLVRVDIDLMGIALVIDGWFVDVPVIDGISEAFWGNWSRVSIVVVWSILLNWSIVCRVVQGCSNAENSSES